MPRLRVVLTLNGTLINPDFCTIQTCSLDYAYTYVPSLPCNLAYLATFGAILIAQLCLGVFYRTWGFLAGMIGGLALEVIGYAGRVLLHKNPFNFDYFLIYLVCLTIGPAFLTASIYLCLGRIITVYGTGISRLKPRTYTVVFVSCDFLSLVLQAIGGALASTATTKSGSDLGVNSMIAGLVFQVFSLVLFMLLWAEFVWGVSTAPEYRRDERFPLLRSTFKFKAFQYSLWAASILILIRSVYRVAELQGGFDGSIANNQKVFMALEGPMIILATCLLTVFNPGFSFSGQWHTATWSLRSPKPKRNMERMSRDEKGHEVRSL